ncbi:hypothetical protein [Rhizobium sp. SSA_523]|uniref:hypothetical protein n=1 Tax=Rhizobium sp. SSA_523 TaxID=2952477 RepID=UPI0020909B63|nr:hypothetical protein [Rhizobium sp. SSA_523]MCO5732926.1 hypothetical protein [Rhizobium sp. SSA_523]WKC23814.1 hypothetical protein QTJ18_24060 [Rhizobium sp. SSA_523]
MNLGIYPAILALLLAGTAAAQSPGGDAASPSDRDGNRYHLEKTESGFIRLDQKTGAITYCKEERGNLVCRMTADERTAFEQELDGLERRVEALEQRLAAGAKGNLPSEEEIEQSLSIMERFMRRFMGLIEEFRSQEELSPDRL